MDGWAGRRDGHAVLEREVAKVEKLRGVDVRELRAGRGKRQRTWTMGQICQLTFKMLR